MDTAVCEMIGHTSHKRDFERMALKVGISFFHTCSEANLRSERWDSRLYLKNQNDRGNQSFHGRPFSQLYVSSFRDLPCKTKCDDQKILTVARIRNNKRRKTPPHKLFST